MAALREQIPCEPLTDIRSHPFPVYKDGYRIFTQNCILRRQITRQPDMLGKGFAAGASTSDTPWFITIVGECYVHGLEDAIGLLGPLPSGCHAIIKGDARGRPNQRFVSPTSGLDWRFWRIQTGAEALPANWERATYERLDGGLAICQRFGNLETGELVNSD
jgi:hypothetical protein